MDAESSHGIKELFDLLTLVLKAIYRYTSMYLHKLLCLLCLPQQPVEWFPLVVGDRATELPSP